LIERRPIKKVRRSNLFGKKKGKKVPAARSRFFGVAPRGEKWENTRGPITGGDGNETIAQGQRPINLRYGCGTESVRFGKKGG